MTPLAFSPVEAAIGGGILGMSTLIKLLGNGRVTGLSGTFKGLLSAEGRKDRWRLDYVAGMALGGLLAIKLLGPASFIDALPASFTIERAVLAGSLVGLGSAMGNGCTSGHGLCGNARLSPRSMLFTVVMMVSGAATAAIANTPDALGLARESAIANMALPSVSSILPALSMLGVATVTTVITAVRAFRSGAAKPPRSELLSQGVEIVAGAMFAFGLAVSGMTRPAKVAGFLSVLHPAWDPSLALVMGAALAISMPVTLTFLKRTQPSTGMTCGPAYCSNVSVPRRSDITPELVAGAAIFGAGWGVGGVCPGPAMVNLLVPSPQIAAFFGAMLAAFWMHGAMNKATATKVKA
ncbi:unnamed protein product [Pedinophyceae sp. YPF-701]|nr:unnamed protein product [Pedinophyceae sp. YPF-701]